MPVPTVSDRKRAAKCWLSSDLITYCSDREIEYTAILTPVSRDIIQQGGDKGGQGEKLAMGGLRWAVGGRTDDHSPMAVTVMVRWRGLMSHSR